MSSLEEKSFLESLLYIATSDLQRRVEDLAFRQFETTLAIVVGNGVRIAMGPVGFVLPMDKLITWGIRMVYETAKERQKGQHLAVGTTYNIKAMKPGNLVVKNTNPNILHSIPLPLPVSANFTIAQLISSQPQSRQLLARQLARIDGVKVFQDLWSINQGAPCSKCRQAISRLGSLELGHSLNCPNNIYRLPKSSGTINQSNMQSKQLAAGRKCVICGQPLISEGWQTSGHAPNCILNPQRFEVTSTTIPSLNTFSTSFRNKTLPKKPVCPVCHDKGWVPSTNPSYGPFIGFAGSVGKIPCPRCGKR